MVGLALATAAGAFLIHQGVPFPWTLPSLLLLLRPDRSSPRPGLHLWPLVLAFLAGSLLTSQWTRKQRSDCRISLADGARLEVFGRTEGRVVEGRGEIRVREGLPGRCSTSIRFVLPSRVADTLSPGALAPGAALGLAGEWRKGRWVPGQDPLRAGYLRVARIRPPGSGKGGGWGGPSRIRAGIQSRLGALFPSQGPLVEALVLARKERLAPEVRDAFARAGTAHLLAISGFHVGVVAGLLLLLGSWLGLPHPARFLLGSAGVWIYVVLIGFPDAALRAAFILSLLALGRGFGRPVAPMGALGTAFLLFLLADPGALLRIGFQLSFAGALGLVAWSRPLEAVLRRWPALRSRRVLASGLAAGVSATLATLPLVGWHFGRVSVVGIPVTLLATPLITLAIPGIILSLLLSFLHPLAGGFMAQGVEAILWLLTEGVEWVASLSFSSIWISRPAVLAGCLGLALGVTAPGWVPAKRRAPAWRRLALGALAGILLWPWADLALNRGTLEMVVLDVGQGDALALRSPGGRWILVDAGPKTEHFDAGARTVLPYLRQRGVRELAFLILTHPDMDHVGGAGSILGQLHVSTVLDPGRAVGSQVFLAALEEAHAHGVPWRIVQAGDSLNLDGVALRVLWPPGPGRGRGTNPALPPGVERLVQGSNEASVILELRYGAFSALLTGDAPREVEEAVLPLIHSQTIQLLKVGHHGSDTSTSPELLERTDPELAVISVGRRNRYGHPDPRVVRRIQGAEVRIYRTDRDGPLSVRARKDGTYEVRRLTLD